ncbi:MULTISPECIES: TetR/AcrR family transcriptional regulator [Gordonia]|uniref:TetR/AcrR family transcriptional regulator n=1 Tax=Gordonia TaxID=2053 RepID=UPI0030FE5318
MATDVTRTRLLDAAERILESTPYEQLKVRAVCSEAGVNPAAVHYHFGSREGLVTTLLQERLGPVWADPLTELSTRDTSVGEIVDRILEPVTRLAEDPALARHLRLLGRFVLTHGDLDWTDTWFRTEVWVALLRRVVDVDEATARRRWRFAFTVLITELSNPTPVSTATVAALADFLTAGLSGPVSTSTEGPR